MSLVLDNIAFQQLFPFSFVTDCDGRLLMPGRSLNRVIPEISSAERYQDVFILTRPCLGITDPSPKGLLGEMIVLSLRSNAELQFRGHVVQLATTGAEFLFSLNLSLNTLSQPSQLGLNISDFVVGDPIFDHIMRTQSESLARKRAENSYTQAERRNKILKILHKIALDTYGLPCDLAVYEKTIEAVCTELSLEIGHVYVVSNDNTNKLVSTGIWTTSDPETFKDFKAASITSDIAFDEGLAGRAWSSKQVLWSSNIVDAPFFGSSTDLVGNFEAVLMN